MYFLLSKAFYLDSYSTSIYFLKSAFPSSLFFARLAHRPNTANHQNKMIITGKHDGGSNMAGEITTVYTFKFLIDKLRLRDMFLFFPSF